MGSGVSVFSRGNGPIKTLVLGCMGAGKSCFIRQMIKNYTRSICYQREYYVYCVQLNLLNVYRELKNVCQSLEIEWSKFEEDFEFLDTYKHRQVFAANSTVVATIMKLRGSGLFEACRKKQRILQLPQNYNFFIQRAEEFMSEGYVPTENDIMMSYSQTIGHNSETVVCQSFKFELLEMPGHHIWRARWDQFFENTSVVVFVIDLSELCDPAFYDSGHLENKTVSVFTQLVNHPMLLSVFWMLMFNKNDTFNDHAAGFDFKKLASHLDTADSARSFYRSQFTTVVPKGRCYAHIVSLVNYKESQSVISEMFKKIGKLHRERMNMM